MRYARYLILIVIVLMCCSGAHAQCSYWYSLNYVTYANESTDGTYIYTSVLTDGNANMGINNSGCPDQVVNQMQQAMNSATHQAGSYNSLGGSGGWGWGDTACVSCYLSYENDNSIDGSDGSEYEFGSNGQVYCSVGGSIFNGGSGDAFLSIHRTTYRYSSRSDVCYYNVFCPTSPHICGPDVVTVQPPCSQNYFITVWLKVRVGLYSSCFPGPSGVLSDSPLSCS
jgi:hypothetical protein